MSGSVSAKNSSWIFNGDALACLSNVKTIQRNVACTRTTEVLPIPHCGPSVLMSNVKSSPWAMVYSQNRCLLPCYIRAFQHGDSINPVYEISGLQWFYTCAHFTTIPDTILSYLTDLLSRQPGNPFLNDSGQYRSLVSFQRGHMFLLSCSCSIHRAWGGSAMRLLSRARNQEKMMSPSTPVASAKENLISSGLISSFSILSVHPSPAPFTASTPLIPTPSYLSLSLWVIFTPKLS